MAEPRTVRRLKGQPDRWRRTCDRSTRTSPTGTVDILGGADIERVLRMLHEHKINQPGAGTPFAADMERVVESMREASRMAGECMARFIANVSQAHHG